MKIMMLAAVTVSVSGAAPAFAGERATEWTLTGGTMEVTGQDGVSHEGTTIGVSASVPLLLAKTDSGIGIDVRAKGGVEAVDLHGTQFSYFYEDEQDGRFDVYGGYEVDGRAHAALELGVSYAGFRLAAATGFQAAHVGQIWEVDGPRKSDDYQSAYWTYAAGQMTEFNLSYTLGNFSVGAYYQRGDLVLSENEYQSQTVDYALKSENVGGMISWNGSF